MKHAFVSIVGSGAGAQLLLVASTPLLTRVYDEQTFGRFGVAVTLALVASTLLSLRLEHATHVSPLGADTVCRSALTTIAIFACSVISLLAGLAVFVGVPQAPWSAVDLRSGDLPWIFGFAVGHAVHAVGLMLLNYRRRFRTIATIVLLVPTVFLIGALGIPSLRIHANPLLVWQCVAYAVGAGAALFAVRDILVPSVSGHRSGVFARPSKLIVDWLQTLRCERDSWRFLVPSQLLSIGALNIAVVGAALVFDPATAGLILIAQRIARTPVTMLGNTLNEVLRSTIPDRAQLVRTFRTIVLAAFAIAVSMVVSIQLIPHDAYALLLGAGWSALGPVLTITVFGAAAQLIGSSVASLLTALDRRSDFLVNASLAMVGVSSLWFAARLELDATTWLWWQIAGNVMVYGLAFALAVRALRRA